MFRYKLYIYCKYAKFIGLLAFIISWFHDAIIFKLLCCFSLLLFGEIALSYSTWKCSILQLVGINKVNKKYGDNIPNIDNYECSISYDLPFNGEWTVVNGCFTKEYSHSWEIPTQRYAYDFIMLDESGKSWEGNTTKAESYYCYDKAILSPADGVIIEIVNKSKDSLLLGSGQFFSYANHIAGNYIVIQHGEKEYSTLAHLKKDSILVKVGDKVTRGQEIARCGNTGNSSEPHLHFQLQDGPSFYFSAGLPIRFSNIKINKPSNYGCIDKRPCMDTQRILPGRITRGYNVSNNN